MICDPSIEIARVKNSDKNSIFLDTPSTTEIPKDAL
jgi:hypothetical protein